MKNKNKNKKPQNPQQEQSRKKKSAKLVDWPSSLRTWSGSGQRKECQDYLQSGSCQGESKTNLVAIAAGFGHALQTQGGRFPGGQIHQGQSPPKRRHMGLSLYLTLLIMESLLAQIGGKHIHSSLIFILK